MKDVDTLTLREVEVLAEIAQGLENEEICKKLFISHKTVKNHISSIFWKLDAKNRVQAILIGLKRGIIHLDKEVSINE